MKLYCHCSSLHGLMKLQLLLDNLKMCGGKRTETILNSVDAKGYFKIPNCRGMFARMHSCHLKRLSCVIFMKETFTARRKIVCYCPSEVKGLKTESVWNS